MQPKSNKGKWIIGVIVVIIIIIIAILAGGKKSSGDTIKVGIIAPLTGSAAAYGTEGKNSVVLALDEINAAGGINGKKIEYTVEDGKCDTKGALDAWNKLVSINKVQVVFGGHCSTESVAIAPLSAKAGIPVFAVFATAPKMENEGEWFFRHVSTNAYYGVVLADEAFKRGYRKTSIIAEQKDFPGSYADAFIAEFKKLGGQIVLDERFAPDITDYRTIALKLKGTGYDSIFVSAQGAPTMGLVTAQIKDLGLEKFMMYNHAFSYGKFIESSKGYVPKDYILILPLAEAGSPALKAFNDAYTAKYGKLYSAITPYFIAADYDLVHRFRDAAVACMPNGTLDITCIRDQFKNATSYTGAAGTVRIGSDYSPHGAITPVGVAQYPGGVETITAVSK
ncbi:MAG: ABC transporter substrate-binding protein [Patescibacteria group bacterium]